MLLFAVVGTCLAASSTASSSFVFGSSQLSFEFDAVSLSCGACGKTPCLTPAVVSQSWMAKDGRRAVVLANFGTIPVNYTARVDVTNYTVAVGSSWNSHRGGRGGRVWTVVSIVVKGLDAAVLELTATAQP